MMREMYDVIVVGAGPAGCTAAKRCSEGGLKTLLVEKLVLPRRKVCDTLIGDIGLELIRNQYGDFPAAVSSKPPFLKGMINHVPGSGRHKADLRIPQFIRSELDLWMCKVAVGRGVEFRPATNFVGFTGKEGRYVVSVRSHGEEAKIETRYLVGADGANSRVRSSILPDTRFVTIHQGADEFDAEHSGLSLEKDYVHFFYDLEEGGLLGFSVQFKDDMAAISYAALAGGLDHLIRRTRELLAKEYGFDVTLNPIWSGRCVEPEMARELSSGEFKPAKGNVLLVGDAGGFMLPVGEGIGPSVKSGVIAAESILRAAASGEQAEEGYLENLAPLLASVGNAYKDETRMIEASEKGGDALLELIRTERETFFIAY